jgi:hypothetical protein
MRVFFLRASPMAMSMIAIGSFGSSQSCLQLTPIQQNQKERLPMFRKKVLFVGVSVLLILIAPLAAAVAHPMFFQDSFDQLVVHQPGDTNVPYWVIINGDQGQAYANCDDAGCVTAEKQGQTTFARLQLKPDQTPSNYLGAEISELQTGYSTGQGRWLPTVGHPVIATARVRFSNNYHADGTGGAVGSAGFWMWNSFLNLSGNGNPVPIEAFGFNWSEQGSWLGQVDGMQVLAMQDNAPIYYQRATAMHLNHWMRWTLIWSVDRAGQQRVRYLLDGQIIGAVTLTRAYAPLSFTFWNDNQFVGLDPQTGEITVDYHQPTAPQNFEVDSVLVIQP